MGPSGWVSGWMLAPLERLGAVTIHTFTFTLCNRGRRFWGVGAGPMQCTLSSTHPMR